MRFTPRLQMVRSKRAVFVFVGALGALTLISWNLRISPAPAPVATAPVAPAPRASVTPAVASIQPVPTVATVRPATAPTRQQPAMAPLARELSDVFPDLAQRPADWRQFNPERLRVRLFDNTVVEFERVTATQARERTTWIGRTPANSERDEGWLTAVSDRDGYVASLSFNEGGEYSIQAAAKAVVGEASALPELPCAEPLASPAAAPIAPAAAPRASTAPASGAAMAAPENVSVSDVAFMYTAEVISEISKHLALIGSAQTPQAFLENHIRSALELANIYLVNSGIDTFQWRFAGFAQIPDYDLAGDYSMVADLKIISEGIGAAGQAAQSFFAAQGADQLVLLVFSGGKYEVGGRGYMPGHHAAQSYRPIIMPASTMAHELGHNLGCNHDRALAGATDGDGKYNYGHQFTAGTAKVSTIMASGVGMQIGLNQFSNPAVTYEGVPTGVPAGQPKAADNARVIRENAAAMAGYRNPPGAPVITTQPQARSAAAGAAVTLSVTATGANLTYQWFKDNAALAGATGTSFTIASLSSADTGAYTVRVANTLGTVTSGAAAVSIAAPAPVTPGGGASGGSGGGGGAPSHWFLAALTLLCAVRRFFPHHNQSTPRL